MQAPAPARRRRRARKLEDPRSLQRRRGYPRPHPALGRGAGYPHAGLHQARGGGLAGGGGDLLLLQPRHRSAARRHRPLPAAERPHRHHGPRLRHQRRRQCHHAGLPDGAGPGRQGGDPGAALAEYRRHPADPLGPGRDRAAAPGAGAVAGGSRPAAGGDHAGDAAGAAELAGQPDRLRPDAGGAAGDPGALPAHRHLDPGRRGL